MRRGVLWVIGLVLMSALSAVSVGAVPSARGESLATCSAAQHAARVKALKAFEAKMAARRKAFFRTHKRLSARRAFLRAQRARLRALKAAARCQVRIVPATAQVIASIPLTNANRLTFGANALWVNTGATSGAVVARIDPATNKVSATIPIGTGYGADIGFGFGSIWAVNGSTSTLSRIDPTTDQVVATISTQGGSANGLAFSSNNVWVANHNEAGTTGASNAAKIDPGTNQVAATILIGDSHGGPAWLIGAAGSIWTFDQKTLSIVRINPATDATTYISSFAGRSANRHFATDGTKVWFSVPKDVLPAEVQMLDPATNTISTVVSASTLSRYGISDVYGLGYDSGALWLTGPCGNNACALQIAASTHKVSGAWSFPGSGQTDSLELQIAAGSLWVSEHQGILRLSTN